jgi:hypothetical protein
MSIKLLERLTSIESNNDKKWTLILEFELSGFNLRSRINVTLDKEMVPESTEIINSESASISLRNIGASVTYSNQSVCKEKRTVDFSVTSLIFNKTDNITKHINFTWVNPWLLPNNIDICVSVTSNYIKVDQYNLQGINARNGIIELLLLKHKSHFHFPTQSTNFYEIPLTKLWEIGPTLQNCNDTTGWTITWPAETNIWSSVTGKNFIAAQLSKYKSIFVDKPIRRLVLCPYSLGTNEPLLRQYLIEIEIQSRLNIDIRVVSIDDIHKVMNYEHAAVCLYGKSFGFLLKNIIDPIENQQVVVYLNDYTIDGARDQYKSIWEPADEWYKYKSKRNITFLPQDEINIANRVAEMKYLSQNITLIR